MTNQGQEPPPPTTISHNGAGWIEEATYVSVDQEQKTKDKCIGRYWKRYNRRQDRTGEEDEMADSSDEGTKGPHC